MVLFKYLQKGIVKKITVKVVGVKGFEPSAPSPPDSYSNQTELHPDEDQNNSRKFINIY